MAGDRDRVRPWRVGGSAQDDLLREPVDEPGAEDVPAGVQTDETDTGPILDRDHLGQEDGGILDQQVARLEATTTPIGPRWRATTAM